MYVCFMAQPYPQLKNVQHFFRPKSALTKAMLKVDNSNPKISTPCSKVYVLYTLVKMFDCFDSSLGCINHYKQNED